MKDLKSEELGKLSDKDLTKRENELRSELSKLRSAAARGTLKKELGEIKTVRRNIARVLTAKNSRERLQAATAASSKSKAAETVSPKESKGEEGSEKTEIGGS